ncbi:MAG: hypothetical protein HAW58_06730 [Candidatus Thioglobus sp.]|nr:hypothetical protein [Candidatus Thioglobus sp.]
MVSPGHCPARPCDFLIEDKILQSSRLKLIISTQQIIQNGLDLLGVSAPDEM